MDIRQMQKGELEDVLKLHVNGLKGELKLLDQLVQCKSADLRGMPQLNQVLHQMLDRKECYISVAKLDNEIVGYCLATKKIYPIEKPSVCGCINGIFVSEKARRKGTGKKLFELTTGWLKNQGISYLELYYMINDERAFAFWKKMGFVNVQYNGIKKL